MKICVFGAGAVGGNLAARLAQDTRNRVCVVARGPSLDAIRQNGITVEAGDQRFTQRMTASDQTTDLGIQDLVISTLKATSLADLARQHRPAAGPGHRCRLRAERHSVVVCDGRSGVGLPLPRPFVPRPPRRTCARDTAPVDRCCRRRKREFHHLSRRDSQQFAEQQQAPSREHRRRSERSTREIAPTPH